MKDVCKKLQQSKYYREIRAVIKHPSVHTDMDAVAQAFISLLADFNIDQHDFIETAWSPITTASSLEDENENDMADNPNDPVVRELDQDQNDQLEKLGMKYVYYDSDNGTVSAITPDIISDLVNQFEKYLENK